jgi:predicted  nucleic acid-binding Zn-ribbon protein
MAVDVKRIIQEMVVPDLHEIKTRLATMVVEIQRLDEKIDRLDEKIDTVKEDVRNLRQEFRMEADGMKADIRGIREEVRVAIDVHERLATLEAKIGH